MRKSLILTLFLLASCLSGQAQGKTTKKAPQKPNPYKKNIITDVWKGTLPSGNNNYHTELTLQHKPGADEGAFTLNETPLKGKDHNIQETIGEWTVRKGSAGNPNATVVELDAAGKSLFFLRRKDGKLQKLDASFHELLPVKNHLLVKSKKKKK